jgi:predicted nucleotidyltransferase component of viral defense system
LSCPDFSKPGPWAKLFHSALRLMDHLESETTNPPWTFGGGTVLMLRLGHRQSKDIDLFVPDPQYLGYVNPRLSDIAEEICSAYEENAEYIKLRLADGEIDIVVGQSLTTEPFEVVEHNGRSIRVETSAEIIAKKIWHRGDRAKVRDLFDLWAVATMEPEAIPLVAPFMARHGKAFLASLTAGTKLQRQDFDEIDIIGQRPTYGECIEVARRVIAPILRRAG